MGIALPQLAPASEDRVSGGQVIKGALKFSDNGQTELRRTLGASTKFTLSFWYKPTTLTSRDEFFDTSASTGFYLYRHSDGNIRVNTNSSGIFIGLGKYRDPNAFYHVVFQGTGTGLRLYVNGVLDSANNGTSALYAGGLLQLVLIMPLIVQIIYYHNFIILMGLALVQIILDLLTHSQELGDLKSLRKVEPQLIMEQTGVIITVVVNQRLHLMELVQDKMDMLIVVVH